MRSIVAAAIVISALGGLTTTAASRSTAAAGVATPTVTELTGGVTPGFGSNTDPDGLVVGPDGHIWFTEFCGDGGCSSDGLGPGGIGRVNDDGSVTELVGGKAPGFNPRSGPDGITSAGGRVWVGECSTPGRLGQVIQGNKVSEMTGGVRTGFAVDSVSCNEGALTTARNGDVWFTGYSDPGYVSEVVNGGTVRALVGGVTPGFGANRGPVEISPGPNGRVWFTEANDPGGVGRVNADGTVTELRGGVTPGFTKNAHPYGITTGPDGHVWFTEELGGIGRVNDDGTVTELRPGVTPGFSQNARPSHITTGPDGRLWFTEYDSPGRLARINDNGTVSEFAGGATAGFSVAAGPTGLTSGPDGRIWFAEYDRGGIGAMTVGPRVATGSASKLAADSATLGGTVHPNDQQTVFHFEYGSTTAYGSSTSPAVAGTGVAARTVSAALSGLKQGTLYHYRLLATNDTDTAVGGDRTFTTKPGRAGGSSGAEAQAPSAPTHLRGHFAAGTLTLKWAPATDNVGVDLYRLYRDGRALGATLPATKTRAALPRFATHRRTVLGVRRSG